MSPVGDEITVDFAKALVDAEDLGDDEVIDYLSISLSATDAVGSPDTGQGIAYAPNSPAATIGLVR